MRRRLRKKIHYTVHCLKDGTVTVAYPVRKPSAEALKRDKEVIDDDGVCREFQTAGREYSDFKFESRFRFMDVMATAMNTRRIVRELVLPRIDFLESRIEAVQSSISRIEELMAKLTGVSSGR